MHNKALGHIFGAARLDDALATVIVTRKTFINPCGGLPHGQSLVFEQVAHASESIVEELASNGRDGEEGDLPQGRGGLVRRSLPSLFRCGQCTAHVSLKLHSVFHGVDNA